VVLEPDALSGLTHLTALTLRGDDAITNSGLSGLTNLTELALPTMASLRNQASHVSRT
jgi:hypothetical protein